MLLWGSTAGGAKQKSLVAVVWLGVAPNCFSKSSPRWGGTEGKVEQWVGRFNGFFQQERSRQDDFGDRSHEAVVLRRRLPHNSLNARSALTESGLF